MQADRTVKHRRLKLDGAEIFFREAGTKGAPVVLLPHGYPCSSFQYRNFMPALADRWHLIAPDYPGFGYSDTPSDFSFTFDGYATFLERFADALNLSRYALYLHDYGSQIGLRLAIKRPELIAALIIQNGDIYEDQLGPQYAPLREYWAHPTPEKRRKLAAAVNEAGFKEEFLNHVDHAVAERIPPDLWKLHWSLMTPQRCEIAVNVIAGLKENLVWFPKYQAYLREHRPPTLIVWGPRDGYMPEGAARAYLRDLPDAELHLLEDGGHWLLETHLNQTVSLVRTFLDRLIG
jgi:pimeloyl-ACP methyl ester carboxylesterase